MRRWLALGVALVFALPPVRPWMLPLLRPLYRPVDEMRALYHTYRWCTVTESRKEGGEPVPLETPSWPEGVLRLRQAWPAGYPQRLLLEGDARGTVLLRDSVLAGRIVRSSRRWHEAYTLYAPGLCVSVRIGDREVWGMLCGGIPPVLRWIPLYEEVLPGETLVTAGMGDIPGGLQVGVVAQVDTSEVEPGFYLIQVTPFVDYHRTLFFRSVPHAHDVDSLFPDRVLP